MAFSNGVTIDQIVNAGAFGKSVLGQMSLAAFLVLVNLDKVDNTSDLNKPISNAQAAEFSNLQDQIDNLPTDADIDTINSAITSLNTSLAALSVIVDNKADKTDVTALDTRVTALENPECYTTVMRPPANNYVPGKYIFDTDLNKPLWSNGTDWYDATGAMA
jgi:hypothetical protein